MSASLLKRTQGPWVVQAERWGSVALRSGPRPRSWMGTVPSPLALVSPRLDLVIQLEARWAVVADAGGWAQGSVGVTGTMSWATRSGFIRLRASFVHDQNGSSRWESQLYAFSFPATSLTEPLAVEDSSFKAVMKLSGYPSFTGSGPNTLNNWWTALFL